MGNKAKDEPDRLIAAETARAVADGLHATPFDVLGPHGGQVTALVPGAVKVWAVTAAKAVPLLPHPAASTVFTGTVPKSKDYRLKAEAADGSTWEWEDAYRFAPVLGEIDEYLIGEGAHQRLWQALGAHPITHEGTPGTHFAIWAPNAVRVSVVGDFNFWDGRSAMMRRCGSTGVWEVFLPNVSEGAVYKYEIMTANGLMPLKADPVGFGSEHPPATGSVVRKLSQHVWQDSIWMAGRAKRHQTDAAISIYEVHLGSWKRLEGGRMLSYAELAADLIPYVKDLGFTHLELLPITEHPF